MRNVLFTAGKVRLISFRFSRGYRWTRVFNVEVVFDEHFRSSINRYLNALLMFKNGFFRVNYPPPSPLKKNKKKQFGFHEGLRAECSCSERIKNKIRCEIHVVWCTPTVKREPNILTLMRWTILKIPQCSVSLLK